MRKPPKVPERETPYQVPPSQTSPAHLFGGIGRATEKGTFGAASEGRSLLGKPVYRGRPRWRRRR